MHRVFVNIVRAHLNQITDGQQVIFEHTFNGAQCCGESLPVVPVLVDNFLFSPTINLTVNAARINVTRPKRVSEFLIQSLICMLLRALRKFTSIIFRINF